MSQQVALGLIKFGLLIAFVLLFAGQTTKAQSLDHGLNANIPFDFVVGNQTMPAGRYLFKRALQNDDLVLQVSTVTGESNVFRNTFPVTTLRAKNKGVLVFHRYNDQYFLSQVWAAGALTGRSLTTSTSERHLQRNEVDSKITSKTKKRPAEIVTVVGY